MIGQDKDVRHNKSNKCEVPGKRSRVEHQGLQ